MSKQSFKPAFLGVFVSLLLLATSSVSAVEIFKTSNIAGGHQIWFEVEDFDERDPADDSSFAVVDEAGAFWRIQIRTNFQNFSICTQDVCAP